ncbi:MAG TPA: hypothetical protein VKU41_08340 [Polyangiaceae bacterium]|nr:hypothetical protein [Polyangiaceae bacterium]
MRTRSDRSRADIASLNVVRSVDQMFIAVLPLMPASRPSASRFLTSASSTLRMSSISSRVTSAIGRGPMRGEIHLPQS